MGKYGRWTTAEQVSKGIDLTGKTALVTGANSGLGRETARVLALRGADVVMACRSRDRAQAARDELIERHPELEQRLVLTDLDLGSLSSVRRCAERYLASGRPLHLLINNAGVMLPNRRETADGLEQHFGINHVGHFHLTTLLLPRLRESAPARVIMVSSDAMNMATVGPDFVDPNWRERPFKRWASYGDSKLMNIMFARELDRRAQGTGVIAHAVHPGMIPTHLADEQGPAMMLLGVVLLPAMKTVGMGAATTVYAATAPSLGEHGGLYLADCKPHRDRKLARDEKAWKRLWEVTEEQIRDVERRSGRAAE